MTQPAPTLPLGRPHDDVPFLSATHASGDLEILGYMLSRLRGLPLAEQGLPDEPRPLVLKLHEPDGRNHRFVLSNPARLLAGGVFTFVGFFALRNPASYPLDEKIHDTDAKLLAEFPNSPHIVTYSSLELPGTGRFANLVIFSHPDGITAWREGAFHQKVAVDELSPAIYLGVRLHSGQLTVGPNQEPRFELRGTKYLDYSQPR
jgi:hypothetical protein